MKTNTDYRVECRICVQLITKLARDVPNKEYSHDLKVESGGDVLRTSSPGNSISSSTEKLLQGGGGRSWVP